MKKCPFCAEEIQEEAVKCRFCGEFLDSSPQPKPKAKWYYSTSAMVIGLVCLGPLALPLVWASPKYKVMTKIIITLVVIAITISLCWVMVQLTQWAMEQIRAMEQLNDLGLY